jgi:hypothetical protein
LALFLVIQTHSSRRDDASDRPNPTLGPVLVAVFQKFSGCPQLMANWYSTRDKRIGEAQRVQFLTGAWKLANDKARELGWVV